MPEIDIKALEKKWREYWEKEEIYKFNSKTKKKIYSIDTPPPTVSGAMHLGHAFSYSQQDFIARYKRMAGFEVFYPFGTDDNGLPTERLIEKQKNVKSKSMSRADFISLCLKTLKEITPEFILDWKKLGISADYSLSYSTIDKLSRKISQKSFLDLYKQGKIYKAEFPTLYCIECQTPIAQAELEDKEKDSLFTTIKFQVDKKELLIATTRPELLGACIAVFVNPKDKRYNKLIGKKAQVPLFNHLVPIIADESAQMDKGTGVLMVCSYGDKYDADAVKRHKLAPKIIISKHGRLTLEGYKDLTIKQARTKILGELKAQSLIIEQRQIKHTVNVHDKCSTEIEFLPTSQWFIKILDSRKELIKQGNKIVWHPEHMFKRYQNWIQGLEWDWSISRERHFGIPIPLWYCKACNNEILAEEKELPVDPLETSRQCNKCKSKASGDSLVLDTWATSSLTPRIASSLVDEKISIPFSLRPQGHDIIRTWAFYTIVKSFYHEKQIPWKDIAISGNVSLHGEKMSKSKGNVIAPQLVMDQFGSDALRYWASSSKLGEDLDYQEKDLVTGKKFITKLLNATNFVFINLEYQEKMPKLHETDRLFLIQLNKLIESTTKAFEEYNYSKSRLETDNFFWKTFADNYLEIVKSRVYNGTKEEKASAYYTLYHSLLTILKLMAPITPFIAEEVYHNYFRKYEKQMSIHQESWPTSIKLRKEKEDDLIWNKLLEIISFARQKKSEAKKSVKAEIILYLPEKDQHLIKSVLKDIKAVASAKEIKPGDLAVEFL